MNYFVTFCAADQDVGANPMWHSSLLLSQWEEGQEKIEVVHNWGFNPMPSEGGGWANLLLGTIWDSNHGLFVEEKTRFYDRGRGLHGTTFEITKDQFDLLEKQWTRLVDDQKAAIQEVMASQGIKGKPEGRVKYYEHEDYSKVIYQLELAKAKQQGRESRLKPFETCVSLRSGTANSKNCKTQALALLAQVLSEKQINRLTEEGSHPTLPRFSGQMEDLYLHSTGSLRQHQRASGHFEHYREATKDADVKLYWTLPPQEIETISDNIALLFKMDEDYCQRIKPKIKQLQTLEWLFRDAVLAEEYQPYQAILIEQITDCYEQFSLIRQKPKTEKASGWYGYALTLFSAPKDAEEMRLQRLIERVDYLLNSLYMAIVDCWAIDTQYPPEQVNSRALLMEELQPDCRSNPVEAVANYLPSKDKLALCKILGRSYCDSEWSLEESDELCARL